MCLTSDCTICNFAQHANISSFLPRKEVMDKKQMVQKLQLKNIKEHLQTVKARKKSKRLFFLLTLF